MDDEPEAQRHVTRRDGQLEGAPDPEGDQELSDAEHAQKDAQRDLTSLSGPVPRKRA